MKRSIKVIVGVLGLAFWIIQTSSLADQNLTEGIKFLDDVKKVEWYKVNGKHIIIGLKGLPDDFYQ